MVSHISLVIPYHPVLNNKFKVKTDPLFLNTIFDTLIILSVH